MSDAGSPGVQAEIKGILRTILGHFARVLEGTEPIRSRPLDEKFIRVLESALERLLSRMTCSAAAVDEQ